MALAKRPDLLVLDEPLASLDPLARREFLQAVMGAVAQDGVTVLFSSHVVGDLERVCDHLVLLRAGRIALSGDIEELLAFQLVETAIYLGLVAVLVAVTVWQVRRSAW